MAKFGSANRYKKPFVSVGFGIKLKLWHELIRARVRVGTGRIRICEQSYCRRASKVMVDQITWQYIFILLITKRLIADHAARDETKKVRMR